MCTNEHEVGCRSRASIPTTAEALTDRCSLCLVTILLGAVNGSRDPVACSLHDIGEGAYPSVSRSAASCVTTGQVIRGVLRSPRGHAEDNSRQGVKRVARPTDDGDRESGKG